jgi:predicted PurR-regulated permease PerM
MPPLLLAASARWRWAWILLPFYGAIMWALIIAMLSAPHLPWAVASALEAAPAISRTGLVMLLVLVAGVLPFAVVTAALARQASVVYQHIESGDWNPVLYLRGLFDALPRLGRRPAGTRGACPTSDNLQRQVRAAAAQASQFITTQAFGIGVDTFGFVASLGVALYLAFFFVRDGDKLARLAKQALPVAPQFKQELITKFLAVVRATVKGSLLIAGIQGVLGGIAFWFLDVRGALLWAVVMAFLSLLPMIGAGLVWLPVAAYFFITGSVWQSLARAAP